MPEFNFAFSSKLPHIGTTIFTTMSKLALDHNAINLAQGFPDFSIDNTLENLVINYLKEGKNQYAPMQGIRELRELISEKTNFLYKQSYDPENEVLITAGGTQAIFTSIQALIQPNDEVILFTPSYDCYEPAVKLAGGNCKFIELTSPAFTIDWSLVKKQVNAKTKLIIINNPHNPCGSILTANDIIELQNITKGTNILILSDEVYEHMVYDNNVHLSMAIVPELAQRSIIIASFGKVLHATGWKLGYILAPSSILSEIKKVHQFEVFSCNSFLQYAIAEYMKNKDTYLNLNQFYQKKRDLFISGLKQTKFIFTPTSGSYFQCVDYSNYSVKSDIDFSIELTKQFKVASIPISVFYNTKNNGKILRFCFAKKEETLEKALEILINM